MEIPTDDVRLVVLMRSDIPTLNPGKAVAQATHAANQCIKEGRIRAIGDDDAGARDLGNMIVEWEDQTGKGFGTCIVLSATEEQMNEKVLDAVGNGIHAGITHDPTYPAFMPPVPSFFSGFLFCALCSTVMLGIGLPIYALWTMVFVAIRMCADIADDVKRDITGEIIPLDTCGYLFGRASKLREITIGLGLMR